MGDRYDLFISYSTDPDYRLVRNLQSFLEGFHRLLPNHLEPLSPLEVFMDESDLIRPGVGGGSEAAIRTLLTSRLSQSQRLLVVCSHKTSSSPWVAEEVAWFLQHRRADDILIAISEQVAASEVAKLLPASLVAAGLHERPYFDLRGFGNAAPPLEWKVRNFEEQCLALAAFLHGRSSGELSPLWQREAKLRERRLEEALSGALRGQAQAALERSDSQRAATYLSRALEHRESGELRSALLGALQGLWRYQCIGGHHQRGSLSALSWSRDGELIAAVGTSVQVWDQRQQRVLAALHLDRADGRLFYPIGSFSPTESTLLLAGSGDLPVWLWDPTRMDRPLKCGEGFSSAIAAWSPDGMRIAVRGPEELRILERSGTELVRLPTTKTARDGILRWSPSGARLAYCCDRELTVWNEGGARLERTENGVWSFQWAADDRLVFTQGTDVVLEGPAGDLRVPAPSGAGVAQQVALSSSARFLGASFGTDFGIWAFEMEAWTLFRRPDVARPLWAPGRDCVAVATVRGNLLLVNAEGGTFVARELERWQNEINMMETSVAWSPDGARLAGAVRGGKLAVWDGATGQREVVFDADLLSGVRVAWSPNGTALAAGSMHGELQVWTRIDDWRPRRLPHTTVDLVWAPSGSQCASLEHRDQRSTLVIRDADASALREVSIDQPAFELSWSTERLLVAESRGRLTGIDPSTGTLLWQRTLREWNGLGLDTLPARCYQRATGSRGRLIEVRPNDEDDGTVAEIREDLSPDGHLVVLRQPPDALRVLRVADGVELGRVHDDGITGGGLSWSPAGRWLAVHASSGVLFVEIGTAALGGQWEFSAADVIQEHVWSPVDQRLGLTVADGAVLVLDIAAKKIVPCDSHMLSVSGLAWTPDGTALVVTTTYGQVTMFDARTGATLIAPPRNVRLDGPAATTTPARVGTGLTSPTYLTATDNEGGISLWDYRAALAPARGLSGWVESTTGLAMIDGEALDARALFESGLAALLRDDREEGWALCGRALAVAPHGRRFLALYGVAKAALDGMDAGRPMLVSAWETDRSLETYVWLRATGATEPAPNNSRFWTAYFAHMDGRYENRALMELAREFDSETTTLAAVAIGRRQDLAGKPRLARRWYLTALGKQISSIDQIWVKLRLSVFEGQSRGRLTPRVDDVPTW
jgi:WD40 repeat protein